MIPDFVELPAGIIEEKHNFNPLNAAKAELREETGCDPETCTWTYLGKYIQIQVLVQLKYIYT